MMIMMIRIIINAKYMKKILQENRKSFSLDLNRFMANSEQKRKERIF